MTTAEAKLEGGVIPYRGIPLFADWRKSRVDIERWDKAMAGLNGLGDVASDLFRRMRVIIRTAVDSIGLQNERKLSPDAEAVQSAMWLAAISEKGEEAQPAIESQLLAFDCVIEAAESNRKITEEWIRELQSRICRTQKLYSVNTASGVREEALPLGEYKRFQNHVRPHLRIRPAYAPVELTHSEMQKLCSELNSSLFLAAHPVLQASYALYSILIIHPFADGNGRVARSLALLFTYRSNSIPMLALAERRDAYVSSLVSAARGDFQPLVDYVQECAIEAIERMESSMRSALLS
ncbi:MAG: hypothetical protein QOJ64_3445 [Acidobacteriota bacterium]|jgi:Fic family protein|nr:hypothetical protein [Acidobacteriota bacterium]